MSLDHNDRAILAAARRIKARERKEQKAKRPKAEKATRGREIDNGFRQYVRRQPCEARHKGGCAGPIQHAHISYRVHGIANSFGRSVKNHDRHGNPLCAEHHRIQGEVMGEKPFWAWLGKDAYETAAGHYERYLAGAVEPNRKASRQAANDEAGLAGNDGSRAPKPPPTGKGARR